MQALLEETKEVINVPQTEISKQTNDATLLMSKISTAKFLGWNKAEFDRYVDALRNRDLDDV